MKRLIFSLLPLLLLSCSGRNTIVGVWQTSVTQGATLDKYHGAVITTLTFKRNGKFIIDTEMQIDIGLKPESMTGRTTGRWKMTDATHIKANLESLVIDGKESTPNPETEYVITEISKDRMTLVSNGIKNEYRRVK